MTTPFTAMNDERAVWERVITDDYITGSGKKGHLVDSQPRDVCTRTDATHLGELLHCIRDVGAVLRRYHGELRL